MKRWLCMVLAAVLMLTMAVPAYALEKDGFVYEVLADDTVKIVSYNGSSKTLTIPAKIDGKRVSVIGERAFEGNTTLTAVYFGWNEQLCIEPYAFASCKRLGMINFNFTVSCVPEGCFENCTALWCVKTEGDAMQVIEGGAFDGCTSLMYVVYMYRSEEGESSLTIGEKNEAFKAAEPWFNGEEIAYGDMDGNKKINMIDAFQLYTLVSKGEEKSAISVVADYNQDGCINIVDAFLVYQPASGN